MADNNNFRDFTLADGITIKYLKGKNTNFPKMVKVNIPSENGTIEIIDDVNKIFSGENKEFQALSKEHRDLVANSFKQICSDNLVNPDGFTVNVTVKGVTQPDKVCLWYDIIPSGDGYKIILIKASFKMYTKTSSSYRPAFSMALTPKGEYKYSLMYDGADSSNIGKYRTLCLRFAKYLYVCSDYIKAGRTYVPAVQFEKNVEAKLTDGISYSRSYTGDETITHADISEKIIIKANGKYEYMEIDEEKYDVLKVKIGDHLPVELDMHLMTWSSKNKK